MHTYRNLPVGYVGLGELETELAIERGRGLLQVPEPEQGMIRLSYGMQAPRSELLLSTATSTAPSLLTGDVWGAAAHAGLKIAGAKADPGTGMGVTVGFASGAMAGSVFGPIGTLVGGMIGATFNIMSGGMAREAKKLKEKSFDAIPTVVREQGPITGTGAQVSDWLKNYSDIANPAKGLRQQEEEYKFAASIGKMQALETEIKGLDEERKKLERQIGAMKAGYWDTENVRNKLENYVVPQMIEKMNRYTEIQQKFEAGPSAVDVKGAKTGMVEGVQTVYSGIFKHGSISANVPRATASALAPASPIAIEKKAVYGGLLSGVEDIWGVGWRVGIGIVAWIWLLKSYR